MDRNNRAVAAAAIVDPDAWLELFEEGFARIAGRFGRAEPRLAARAWLLGLLSDVDTRSCWQLAEQAGHHTPHRMQSLLAEAKCDADAVRDDLRRYVVDELGEPGGTLIFDDTGDLKSGSHTVGVQRQYTGTAGRIENAQVATFLAYASSKGRALIDRELYLPTSWTDDPARCRAAGVPADVEFATKITHARRMLTRAIDAGVPAAWATADEFYGNHRGLRRDLHARDIGYVLGVAKNHRVTLASGQTATVEHVTKRLPRRSWNRLSAGKGAKGERDYDWAWVRITPPADEQKGHHWLLVRRRIRDGELAFYRCWSPTKVNLAALVRVAGIRWCVEECFRAGKDQIGLDQHQVRKWTSWYRYTTLAMLAHAILSVIAARERDHRPAGPRNLIALTVNEIRHLFAKLITNTIGTLGHWLHWSAWRRQHQRNALISHYRRRGLELHSTTPNTPAATAVARSATLTRTADGAPPIDPGVPASPTGPDTPSMEWSVPSSHNGRLPACTKPSAADGTPDPALTRVALADRSTSTDIAVGHAAAPGADHCRPSDWARVRLWATTPVTGTDRSTGKAALLTGLATASPVDSATINEDTNTSDNELAANRLHSRMPTPLHSRQSAAA